MPVAWKTPTSPARSAISTSAAARWPVQVGPPRWSVTTLTSSRSCAEAQHRRHEVAPARAEQPRGPHDRVLGVGLGDRVLARELRAPVGLQRRDGVGLDPRLALGAVEDVVGRDVHDARARAAAAARDVAGAVAVDAQRARLVGLGAVDVGVRGAVDDRARARRRRRRASTWSASVMSRSAASSATTSWPRRAASRATARPSIPPLPRTSNRIDHMVAQIGIVRAVAADRARGPLWAAALLMGALGTFHAWSVLVDPLQDALGVSRSTVSAVYALATAVFAASMLLEPAAHRRLPAVASGPASALLAAAGLALCAVPAAGAVFVGYGVLFAAANGLGYGLAVHIAATTGRTGASAGLHGRRLRPRRHARRAAAVARRARRRPADRLPRSRARAMLGRRRVAGRGSSAPPSAACRGLRAARRCAGRVLARDRVVLAALGRLPRRQRGRSRRDRPRRRDRRVARRRAAAC